MEVMTIKDFAKSRGVSYEAVRRQVQKYRNAEELEGHVIRNKGVTYLDEVAVAFLSERRRQSPLVVVHEDQNEQIEEKDRQIEELKKRLDILRDELALSQQKRIELQDQVTGLLEDKVKHDLLVADHERMTERLKEVEAERDEVRTERDEARAEAGRYHKSFFGFYRKA